ncbi:MAG TPA: hypothetical protein VHO06_21945 [Polyangia bacterium]|nr:hypothetical protein [Polyangia bacterium]
MPSKRLKLTQEMVATAKENLEAIPSAPRELRPITVSEAIRTLTPTIRRLLDKGHSREAVIELLKQQGIECSPSTFKECYRPGKAKTWGKAAETGTASAQPTTGQPAGESPERSSRPSAPILPVAQAGLPAAAAKAPAAKPAADSTADQRPNAGLPAGLAKAS